MIYFSATEKSPVERQLYRASLDGGDPARPARVSAEDGVHYVVMSRGAHVYVDAFTSRRQPPQVSVRNSDGSLITYLIENRLDEHHPDAPVSRGQRHARVRHAHRRGRPGAALPPVQACAFRSREALSRDRRRVWRPRRPAGTRFLDGRLVHSNPHSRRLRRVPARQPRQRFARNGVPGADPWAARRGRGGGPGAGRPLAGRAVLRRPRRASAFGAGAMAAT